MTGQRHDARLNATRPELVPVFVEPPALPDWDDEDDGGEGGEGGD